MSSGPWEQNCFLTKCSRIDNGHLSGLLHRLPLESRRGTYFTYQSNRGWKKKWSEREGVRERPSSSASGASKCERIKIGYMLLFRGSFTDFLEVDRWWEQDLIKDCGKRIVESKRIHIWCPTKCECVCCIKCTVSNHRGFTWYFQKKHNHLKITVTHILLLRWPTHIKTPASVPHATHRVLRVAVSLIMKEMNWVPAW